MDEHLERTQAFFGARAGDWDERFPDDGPAYAAAAAELLRGPAGVVVDLGCGTGRALSALRRAAGVGATIVGVDVTPEMLHAAASCDRQRSGALVRRCGRTPTTSGIGRRLLRRRAALARSGPRAYLAIVRRV